MTALSYNWGIRSHVYFRDSGESSTQDLFRISKVSSVAGASVTLKEGESAISEYTATIRKIKSFKNLNRNWDGYGAEKPAQQSVDKAVKFVEHLGDWEQPIYFVAPGPNGEVLVELKDNDRTIEVFFQPDGQHEYVMFDREKCVEENNFSFEMLLQLLDWLHEEGHAGN